MSEAGPETLRRAAAVHPIAAQLALAWLLAQGDDIVPIPGTRRIARLDENAAAAGLVLDAGLRSALDGLLAAHAVAGTRYPAPAMANLGL